MANVYQRRCNTNKMLKPIIWKVAHIFNQIYRVSTTVKVAWLIFTNYTVTRKGKLFKAKNNLYPCFNGLQNRTPVILASQIMNFSLPFKQENVLLAK